MLGLGWAMLAGPERATAARPLGIDVSHHQNSITWSSVKASGIVFAWAKATEGTTFTDPQFAINEVNARAAGVYIGAYHFARYDANLGTTGAIAEANYFWSVARNYIAGGGVYLMPALDVEADTTGYSPATLSQWVNQWCQTVVSNAAVLGVSVKPIIYRGATLDSTVTQWYAWIPEWPVSPDPQNGTPNSIVPWPTWNVWQYADDTSVPGIVGNVDGDVFNGTVASLVTTLVIGSAGDGATVVSGSVPNGMATGSTFTASVTLHNSGGIAWTNTGAALYRLGSQNPQDNAIWGLSRVALPSSPINPGASATFTFTATAPLTPGSYAFSWRMLQEGVQWFGDTFTTNINVVVPGNYICTQIHLEQFKLERQPLAVEWIGLRRRAQRRQYLRDTV